MPLKCKCCYQNNTTWITRLLTHKRSQLSLRTTFLTHAWTGKCIWCTFHVTNTAGIRRLLIQRPAKEYNRGPWYTCKTRHHLLSSVSLDTLLLTVPFTRTELAKRAFRCSAPPVWNSLSSFITNSISLTTFKSRLKKFFCSFIFRLWLTRLTSSHSRQRLWSYDLWRYINQFIIIIVERQEACTCCTMSKAVSIGLNRKT